MTKDELVFIVTAIVTAPLLHKAIVDKPGGRKLADNCFNEWHQFLSEKYDEKIQK